MEGKRMSTLAACVLALASGSVCAADNAAGGRIEKVVVRSSAQFDFDRDTVKQEDADRIVAELAAAGQVTWQSVNAVGYTDSVGSPGYNRALSQRRAKAVRDYLVKKGVTPEMIATSGRAAQNPVASNATDEGRAQNRRAEVEFQGYKSSQ